jgi:hypothetical protein
MGSGGGPRDPEDPTNPDPEDPTNPDPEDPINPEDPNDPDPEDPNDPDPEDPNDPDPEDPNDPDPEDPEDPEDPNDPDPEDPNDPQLRRIAIRFGVGTDPDNHGTVTDFDNSNENVENPLLTTILGPGESINYRFDRTDRDTQQPITLSTVSGDTEIPTKIQIFEVDGETRTLEREQEGNEIDADQQSSAFNFLFEDTKTYDITVTNTGITTGAYSLSMNYTKLAALTRRIVPELFTLDPVNIWTDAMVDEVNNATGKWDNVITEMPGTNGATRTLPVNISFQNIGDVFADTNVYETSTDDDFNNNNDLFRRYSTKASVRVNTARYATDWNNTLAETEEDNTDSHALEDIVKREFGKSLGIGGQFWERNVDENDNFHTNNIWLDNATVFTNSYNGEKIQPPLPSAQVVENQETIQDNKNYLLYVGEKALNVYTTIHGVDPNSKPTINGQETDYEFDLGEFGPSFADIIAPSRFDGISASTQDATKVGTFLGIPVVSGRNMPFEGAHINPVPNGGGYLVTGSEGPPATEVQTGIVRLITRMHLGLGDEIMTSFFEPFADRSRVNGSQQQPHPISAISVGFLDDLGYTVDYGGAEPFSLGGNGQYNAIYADPEGE